MNKSLTLVALSLIVIASAARAADLTLNDSNSSEVNLPYKYVGHVLTHKFHRPSCQFARVMCPDHVQLFHFRRQAIESGYIPCNYCLPPWWTIVHATILNQTNLDNQAELDNPPKPLAPM